MTIKPLLCLLFSAVVSLAQNPNTAAFPAATATDTTLLVATNNAQTTLNGAINASVTSIVLTSATRFVTPMAITIDSEVLRCTSHVTTTYTCTRGFAGSTAASHANGAKVQGLLIDWHHNQLSAELVAIEASLANIATPGGVLFGGSAGTPAQDAGNFFWNSSTHRICFQCSSPIHAVSNAGKYGGAVFAASYLDVSGGTVELSANDSVSLSGGTAATFLKAIGATGDVSIGSSALSGGIPDNGYRLDVQRSGSAGTERVFDQTLSTGWTTRQVRAGVAQGSKNLDEVRDYTNNLKDWVDSSYGRHVQAIQFGTTSTSNPYLKQAAGLGIAIRSGGDTIGAFANYTACNAAAEGAWGAITDSSTATWGATVTGGGANHILMYCDGTNWTVLGK